VTTGTSIIPGLCEPDRAPHRKRLFDDSVRRDDPVVLLFLTRVLARSAEARGGDRPVCRVNVVDAGKKAV
jgi:hypothetical protein